MRGSETPGWIVTNFWTDVLVGVHDVALITSDNIFMTIAYLGGLGVVWGQILGFFIDLHRRRNNTSVW